ncbi:MAG: bifunctional DNA-formamidopyrimidine glycosylase/DNA-(apurinic or apyrimidinic site) lyase [Gemmatimonadales bacterium]
MPELPEVETIVTDLRPELVGRKIERARLSHTDVLRGVSKAALLRGLAGSRIKSLERRAKHAVMDLGRNRLVIQPGMSGALLLHDAPQSREDRRYAVLRAELDNGRILVYRDVRRLGTILLLDDAGWEEYDQAIGPEPLARGFTAARLADVLRGSRQAVKKVIMDQRRLAGVGNIYANEALWEAKIDPSRPADSITGKEIARLRPAITGVLRRSIRRRGTTFRDYRTGTGEPGNNQSRLKVYGREGEPCLRCGTRLTGTHSIDGRITVFCHRCQR